MEGFTSEIPYYMHLSDFFVGKPGPGSISEAMHMQLPVVVERNAWTLPQERYNTDWIREMQVGVVLPSFREIDARPARDCWTRPTSPAFAPTPRLSRTARYSRFLKSWSSLLNRDKNGCKRSDQSNRLAHRNSGQLNGFGWPPALVFRKSQTNAHDHHRAARDHAGPMRSRLGRHTARAKERYQSADDHE